MDENKLIFVLQSRKFWSAVIGLAAIVYTAWQSGGAVDPDTLVNAILGIVMAYMGATALEDGLSNHNANKTTVTTPGESNVTVTAPPDEPVASAKPRIGPDGLR